MRLARSSRLEAAAVAVARAAAGQSRADAAHEARQLAIERLEAAEAAAVAAARRRAASQVRPHAADALTIVGSLRIVCYRPTLMTPVPASTIPPPRNHCSQAIAASAADEAAAQAAHRRSAGAYECGVGFDLGGC